MQEDPALPGLGPADLSARSIASVLIGGQTLVLLLPLIGTPAADGIFDDRARSPIRQKLARTLLMPTWALSRPADPGLR